MNAAIRPLKRAQGAKPLRFFPLTSFPLASISIWALMCRNEFLHISLAHWCFTHIFRSRVIQAALLFLKPQGFCRAVLKSDL